MKTLLCIAPLGRYDYDNFRPAFTKMYNHMRTYILFIHISTCSNVHTPECLIFCEQFMDGINEGQFSVTAQGTSGISRQ